MTSDLDALLELIKATARSACLGLRDAGRRRGKHRFLDGMPREMKADVDRDLEARILERLSPAGLPILSEESGAVGGHSGELRFVVDPLDGTVNYVRGLGPASVSIAVCRGNEPLVGAIGVYPSGELAWGGAGAGAFLDGRPVQVSSLSRPEQAVLCTGFPVRMPVEDKKEMDMFSRRAGRYGKVRMLGAASISLLQVAKGAAELYAERNIMLWDVAAGLAIVSGAGGRFSMQPMGDADSFDVCASNGVVEVV